MKSESNNSKSAAKRIFHQSVQTELNVRLKPKPRGSEPPIQSNHTNKSTESAKLRKPSKSKEPVNKYKSIISKPESLGKDTLKFSIPFQQPKDRNSVDRNESSLNKLKQISSPKAGTLTKEKIGNNWSMPVSSSASNIRKQNLQHLHKVDSVSNQSNMSNSSTKLKITSATQIPLSPPSMKITTFQQISKIPRFSDLGLMLSDDEEEPILMKREIIVAPKGRKAMSKEKSGKATSQESKTFSKDSKSSSNGGQTITNSSKISNKSQTASNKSTSSKKAPKKGKIVPKTSVVQGKILSNSSVKSNVDTTGGSKQLLRPKDQRVDFKKKDGLVVNNCSGFQARHYDRYNPRNLEFKRADFKTGAELGSGKYGKVNIVKHIKTGIVCALKTVPKGILKRDNIINQFTRQLKIQSCLSHPNIAKLYGFFDDRQFIYLLMQLGTEGQLYQIMKRKKRFNEATVIYIIRQLCEAVKYLHGQHILHRDIKPENLVITYGTIKLCDFGWAVEKGSQLRSTFCGTPLYISPELLKGHQYDEKIDVWAIGILTYQLLFGDIPFEIQCEQELIKIIQQDIVFPTDIFITAEAKDFIVRILQKNPEDRLKIQKFLEHPFLRRHINSSNIQL